MAGNYQTSKSARQQRDLSRRQFLVRSASLASASMGLGVQARGAAARDTDSSDNDKEIRRLKCTAEWTSRWSNGRIDHKFREMIRLIAKPFSFLVQLVRGSLIVHTDRCDGRGSFSTLWATD